MYISVTEIGDLNRELTFINRNDPLSSIPANSLISPIFPVISSSPKVTPSTRSCFILFCYHQHPFSTIGRICAILNDERVRRLWFSHGLANLIVISEELEFLEEVKKISGDDLLAWERWNITEGRLQPAEYAPASMLKVDIEIPPTNSLQPDVQCIITEYFALMGTVRARSLTYFPEHQRSLNGIHGEVCKIINELIFFSATDHERQPPSTLEDAQVATLLSDLGKKIGYVHSLIDQLLQINSALNYILNQGYTGIVPILQNQCPMRLFSLLGIGRSVIALSKVYESASTVFANYPIPRIIKETYETDYSQIPIFANFSDYDVEEWRNWSSFLDGKLRHLAIQNSDQMFHLTYFSRQRGFRETLYAITAAIQSLFTAAFPKWSLLTITHEFLHAHVRAIMAVLFPEKPGDSFTQLFDLYKGLSPSGHSIKINMRQRLALIIMSILHSIVESGVLAENLRHGRKSEQRSIDLSYEQCFKAYLDHYKDINEFITHTLDFIYFYSSDKLLYIKLLWLSWATIPEIQQRIEHYLLRTLLAISIDRRGTLTDRFESSHKDLLNTLREIRNSGNPESDQVIHHAINILEEPTKTSPLKAQFTGAVRLADMARHLLYSININHDIADDDLLITGEDGIQYYPIETCGFQDRDIQSPVSFLVDRVRLKLKDGIDLKETDILHETCWEMLVLSSSNLIEGGKHV